MWTIEFLYATTIASPITSWNRRIYIKENNLIDLFLVLLRYSSLVFDTIPSHRDYQTSFSKERTSCKKKLPIVIKELEALKPQIRKQVEKLYTQENAAPHMSTSSSLKWPVANDRALSSCNNQRMEQSPTRITSWEQNDSNNPFGASNSINHQLQKLSVSLPLPKEETLSRHSILGPNGLRGQWLGPRSEIKVYYPTNTDFATSESTSLIQVGQEDLPSKNDISVLSLDNGIWSSKGEDLGQPFQTATTYDDFPLIKQPSPPPVLARAQPENRPLSPSRAADPRSGPAAPSSNNTYQNLHIPIKMMDDFLRLAKENTGRNLETCGVLAGSLVMLPEAIAIVMAPTDTSSPHGIFHLSDPGGVGVINKCQKNAVFIHTKSPMMEARFTSIALMFI